MQIFDLKSMQSHDYEQRHKNVFFKTPEFKARIIDLPPGGEMPDCDMASYVVFTVIEGSAMVTVNQETTQLQTGHCLMTEPAKLSMKTETGVKILGLQITKTTT